jgi:hypothetical protein
VAGSCEYDNESSDSTKRMKFLIPEGLLSASKEQILRHTVT